MLLSDIWLSVWRLSVAYIGPKSRTERPRRTKIGTEIAHVTRDSDTTFKVKGQGHQAALLSVALTHKVAAAVSMECIRHGKVLLRCIQLAACEALGSPWGRRGVGAYRVATRTTCLECPSLVYQEVSNEDRRTSAWQLFWKIAWSLLPIIFPSETRTRVHCLKVQLLNH